MFTNVLYSYYQGLSLGMITITLSTILDNTISINYTKDMLKENTDLYFRALYANYINLLLLSPIYYIFVYNYFLDLTKDDVFYISDYSLLLITHNIGYYGIHKMMHKVKMFKFMHDFHHMFKKTIATVGNAVDPSEFNLAYVLPFIVGSILVQPNNLTFKCAIMTISLLNLFIHCPNFKELYLPPFLVSPKQHMKHHENYSGTYSAPLFNIDYFLKLENLEGELERKIR